MPLIPQQAIDVQSAEAAERAAADLSRFSELAVDVEADAMHAFRARLCFVQIACDERIYLFDALAPGVTIRPLESLFADASRTKFFHAAGGDLQYLAEAGVRVKGLFDTHRAATLLSWPKVGLADLVQERLGIKLKKEHQQADFSVRPLPPEMREYIADDVRYLVEIGRQMREECRKADALEEVELDCQRLADEAVSRPEVGSDFRPKIPRGGPPEKVALTAALVDRLHRLRLKWAEEANVPMGRMLSNAAVMAIASRPPSSLRELARREGVRGAFVREHGEEVLAAIRELVEQSRQGKLSVELPSKGSRDSRQKKREEALKAFRSEKAKERGVHPSVVLPNALVEELAKSAPRSLEALAQVPYFGEKRLRLYGREILELLG